jgi:hypothetical protein
MDTHAPPQRRTKRSHFRRPGTWTPVNSRITEDRGFMGCSLPARYLYLIAWLYGNRQRCDGRLTQADIRRVGAESQLNESETAAATAELMAANLWASVDGDYMLLRFLEWNRSATEVGRLAAANRSRVSKSRQKKTEGQINRSTEAQVRTPLRNALHEPESDMPRQESEIAVVEVWESIVGRKATLSEITYTAWWIDQYNRLSPNDIIQVLKRIHGREMDKGTPDHPIEYYTGPIRDLNDAVKLQRGEQSRGEGEPPTPGNGHVTDEQLVRLRRQVADMAANKGL